MDKQFYFEQPEYKERCSEVLETSSVILKDILLSKNVLTMPEKVEIADEIKRLNMDQETMNVLFRSIGKIMRSRIRNLQQKCLHKSKHRHPTGLCDWVCDICGKYIGNGYSGQGKVSDWYYSLDDEPDEEY